MRLRIGTITTGRDGLLELLHRAGLGRRLFYDWADPTAEDLSSQPVALLPRRALSPCSVAAICCPWWLGQGQ